MNSFTITKTNSPKRIYASSQYNTFFIDWDENKGTGIYMELPETTACLVKVYRTGTKQQQFLKAISYLLKKELFIS